MGANINPTGTLPSSPHTADVVLNVLTSAGMVAASLASVSAFGHLIDISKRDIWSHGMAAAERSDVSYSLVALDFLPAVQMGAALTRLAAAVARSGGANLVRKVAIPWFIISIIYLLTGFV